MNDNDTWEHISISADRVTSRINTELTMNHYVVKLNRQPTLALRKQIDEVGARVVNLYPRFNILRIEATALQASRVEAFCSVATVTPENT